VRSSRRSSRLHITTSRARRHRAPPPSRSLDTIAGVNPLELGDLTIGGGSPFVLIAGPCVIESHAHAIDLAGRLADIARRAGVPFIFKASYDKANRTSIRSFRGPGLDEGLRTLAAVKSAHRVPILT